LEKAIFVSKAFFSSAYIKNHPKFSPIIIKRIVAIINTIFIIITILVLVSIPFLWYGTIEELASTGGHRH
jgi:hypothetical protein